MSRFDVYRKLIANYSGEEFLSRFDAICKELYTKLDVLTFAFILYDESTPELRDALQKSVNRDAIDDASGDYLLVFTLRDETEVEFKPTMEWLSQFSGTSRSPRKSYSRILKTLFDEESYLVFPSVLFFQVIDDTVHDYRLVPLQRQSSFESIKAIQDLLKAMAVVLDRVEPQLYGNQEAIYQLIEHELDNRKFTMFLLHGPRKLLDLVIKIKKIIGLIPS